VEPAAEKSPKPSSFAAAVLPAVLLKVPPLQKEGPAEVLVLLVKANRSALLLVFVVAPPGPGAPGAAKEMPARLLACGLLLPPPDANPPKLSLALVLPNPSLPLLFELKAPKSSLPAKPLLLPCFFCLMRDYKLI